MITVNTKEVFDLLREVSIILHINETHTKHKNSINLFILSVWYQVGFNKVRRRLHEKI